MIIDCISDLHGHYPELEGGDLLIVAGDLTAGDAEKEHLKFFDWLYQQKYVGIVFIAGNHDTFTQNDPFFFNRSNPNRITEITRNAHVKVQYLCDSGTEFHYFDDRFPEEDTGFLPNGKRTLKIWGSPWTKTFPRMNPHCKAFTCDTEEELAAKWTLIPEDTDILITHGPPYGILDKTNLNEHAGSQPLYELLYKQHINPRLHIFGHIHESHGQIPKMLDMPSTRFINASHVNESYEPVNKPIRVIL